MRRRWFVLWGESTFSSNSGGWEIEDFSTKREAVERRAELLALNEYWAFVLQESA